MQELSSLLKTGGLVTIYHSNVCKVMEARPWRRSLMHSPLDVNGRGSAVLLIWRAVCCIKSAVRGAGGGPGGGP